MLHVGGTFSMHLGWSSNEFSTANPVKISGTQRQEYIARMIQPSSKSFRGPMPSLGPMVILGGVGGHDLGAPVSVYRAILEQYHENK